MTTLNQIAQLILSDNNFEILSHRYPDGDTLGCSLGLCLALQSIGKNARVKVSGGIPIKFEYLTKGVKEQSFTPKHVITVDIAAPDLLGDLQSEYENNIYICIDHHCSNKINAKYKFVDHTAAAACEIVYDLIGLMNIPVTKQIANCIYTGISTDTGCFRYSNTTYKTHEIAAKCMAADCDWFNINQEMFEIKTKQKVRLERMVYDTMEYFANGKCAIIYTTLDMQKKLNLGDDDLEGLASIPRQIEGVLIGITMREKEDGTFRVSVRTNNNADASKFCKQFGGGGHSAAAGCSIKGSLSEVKEKLALAAEKLI